MSASNDDNVYIKRGNRYIPFGRRCDENYLPDGIWYVHHDKHSHGYTNADHYLAGLFKVGDAPKPIDIPKLCSMSSYVDYVLASKEFRELIDSGRYSFHDLTARIVALVVNLNDTIKGENNDDNKRPKRDFNPF